MDSLPAQFSDRIARVKEIRIIAHGVPFGDHIYNYSVSITDKHYDPIATFSIKTSIEEMAFILNRLEQYAREMGIEVLPKDASDKRSLLLQEGTDQKGDKNGT